VNRKKISKKKTFRNQKKKLHTLLFVEVGFSFADIYNFLVIYAFFN